MGDSLAEQVTYEQQSLRGDGGNHQEEEVSRQWEQPLSAKALRWGAAGKRPVCLEQREGGGEGRERVGTGLAGPCASLFLHMRWEPWRVLCRGGTRSDLGFHRIPLAACGKWTVEARTKAGKTGEAGTAIVGPLFSGHVPPPL